MFSYNKIRLPLLSCIVLLIGASLSVAPVLADGAVLRAFDAPKVLPPQEAFYFPIGVTFDGTNLYYSQPTQTVTRDTFHITPTGTLLNTFSSISNIGALAWDGTHLWAGEFAGSKTGASCTTGVSGCAFLYEIDVSTGNVIKTVDISAVFAPDQQCSSIDGLSYDSSTGSLWVSPDVGCNFVFTNNICSFGFVYNVDTNGNLIRRIQFPFAVSGVAVTGKSLYVVDRCEGTSETKGFSFIDQVTPSGQVISRFPISQVDPNTWAESIAFDPTSFAPNCAIWAVQPYSVPNTIFAADLVAYQIGCS